MTDKRVGVRIDVGVGGQKDVQDLTTGLDGLSRGATGAGQAGKTGATGARELGQAAQGAAAGAAQASKAVAGLGDAAGKADDKIRGTEHELQQLDARVSQVQRTLGTLRDQLLAGFTFQQFVQAAAQMEQVQAGLQAVSGDSKVAGEQMAFVRRMAQAAGVDVEAAGKAFLGLAAATKGTAVEGEPARQVFEAVTLAMAKAGKGSAETQNALLALSQIAGKGTVQMEELRGQLGEALPGALQAAAKGLGITTQDLIKLVEAGGLAAEDLFPALAKGLGDLYGSAPAAQTLSQEITNIKNAFVEMAANIGDEGGLTALKAGAEGAQTAITFLGDTLIQTGQYLGTLAAAVVSLDFSGLSAAFAQIEKDSRERLLKAAEHNTVLQAALKVSGVEASKSAEAAREAFTQHERAGAAAEKAGTSVAKLGVEYAKARAELEQQLGLATKEVEAVKARGQAAIAQASALNDEAAKRKAVGDAAAAEAEALGKVAKLRQAEVELLEKERAAKEVALKAAGPISEQRKKELEDLDALIAKKRVEADTSAAQAAASREKAKATSAEAQAAQALRESAESLNVTRLAGAKAALSDLQVQKDLARQAEELARLIGDEEGIRRAKITQLEIEIKLVKARAEVAKAEAEGSIAVAKAKLAELEATGQLTPLKKAEIEATIKIAEAKLREAKAIGGSTRLLEEQIRAAREASFALDGTAHSAHSAADAQGNLARGVGGSNAVLVEHIRLLSGATDEQRRYAAALDATYRAQLQLDKSGPGAHNRDGTGGLAGFNSGKQDEARDEFGRTKAQRDGLSQQGGPVDNSYAFSLRDRLRRGGTFSANEIPAIEAALQAARTNARLTTGSSVQGLSGARDAEGWVRTLERVLATAQGQQIGAVPQPSAAESQGAARPASPAAAGGATRTLRLDLGAGRSIDYQATSDAEAARVETLLRTLANESARAAP